MKRNWKGECTLLLCQVGLFATPWTVALQAPWDFPGKNAGVGFHFLLHELGGEERDYLYTEKLIALVPGYLHRTKTLLSQREAHCPPLQYTKITPFTLSHNFSCETFIWPQPTITWKRGKKGENGITKKIKKLIPRINERLELKGLK